MDVNISVAVRVRPPIALTDRSREPNVVIPGAYPNTITVNNVWSFQVDHVLPVECNQSQFFGSTVNPLITYLLEGYDVSTIAYGQAGSGKSYTVLGPGPHCALSEMEYGIAPRATREVFNRMRTYSDRKFRVSVSFVEIYQEVLRDLLNPSAVNGNLQIKEDPCLGMIVDGAEHIECQNTAEVFNCLLAGMNNRLHGERTHTIFSLFIEQQIRSDQPVQHRVSQLMLVDLAGSERLCSEGSVRLDVSLAALGNLIYVLANQQAALNTPGSPHQSHLPYKDSKLTHLLKGSFGGRAITLFICCVSGAPSDTTDTINTLNCGQLVQAVKNRPTVNVFVSPVSTSVYSESRCRSASASIADNMFGMEFVMHQWKRLVTDAEGLFHQITEGQGLSVEDLEHIQRWLCLKQECEEIVASQQADSLGQLLHRSLDVIGELSESEEKAMDDIDGDGNSVGSSGVSDRDSEDDKESERDGSDSESNVKSYLSNNQSDVETEAKRIWTPEFLITLDNMIEEFKITTDHLVQEMQDIDSSTLATQYEEVVNNVYEEPATCDTPSQRLVTRRNSIRPDSIVHKPTITDGLLGTIDEKSSGNFSGIPNTNVDLLRQSQLSHAELMEQCNNVGSREDQMKHVMLDLQGVTTKINELEYTIQLKEEMLQNLILNSEVRLAAKQRLEHKLRKIQDAYKNSQLKLAQTERLVQQQTHVSPKLMEELERYHDAVQTYKQRLKDISSIHHLTEDSAQRTVEMEHSLEASKRQLEKLKKQQRREEKLKISIEKELYKEQMASRHTEPQKALEEKDSKVEQEEQNKDCSKDGTVNKSGSTSNEGNSAVPVLEELPCGIHDTREGVLLKKAIRKLRKTKDCLIAQRCEINKKYCLEKVLTAQEERKILELEEAIEAIDTAIEFKNEVLCGRSQDIISDSTDRDTGENQLMERLVGLSQTETKLLLCKYFQKVIDLRDSSRKLEIQVVEHETHAELQTWRFQALGHALQQARYAEERRLVEQQHAYEEQLHLLLRHCAEESGTSGAEGSNSVAIATHGAELELRRENRILRRKLEEAQLTVHTTSTRREAHSMNTVAIPELNLRRLQATGPSPTTRITREKNKLVIQQHKPRKSPG